MAIPTLTEVRDYLGLTGSHDLTIADALEAEAAAQAAVCNVGDYPPDLAQALKRRVARNIKMRANTLGVFSGDIGLVEIGSSDPEVRRLEKPYLKKAPRSLVVG